MPDPIAKAAFNRRPASTAFLQSLIRRQRDGEAVVQAAVAEACRASGCTVETLHYRPDEVPLRGEFAAAAAMATDPRDAVIARLPGTGGGRSVILFAHPDGEPVAGLDRWRHDPFAGTIANGRLHGWGVADDLAGVAIMVEAIAVLVAAGFRPGGDVILASTPSKRHARGVAAVLAAGHRADAAVYLHPAESGVGLREVKAFCAGQLQFSIRIVGEPPATTEPGHTAFAHRASNPIAAAGAVLAALAALDAARGERVRHPRLEAAIGRSTNLLVAHIAGGDPGRLARVAGECVLGGAISFPPGEAMAAVQAEIAAAIGGVAGTAVLDWIAGMEGAELTEAHPLFAAASDAVLRVTAAAPVVNPLHTASDIRVPAVQAGIPTIGLGPLGGDLSQNGAHDEWVDLEDTLRSIEVTARLIAGWCGQAEG